MKNSNVIEIEDSQPVGWLIYRPDTQEFFYSHRSSVGYSSNAYVLEPSLAYLFDSEKAAFRHSTFIDRPTEILPLFDLGDKLAVVFTCDTEA